MNSKRIKDMVLFGLLGFGLSGAVLVASILQGRDAQVLPTQQVEAAQSIAKPAERTWQPVSTLTGENLKRGEVFEITSDRQRLSYTLTDTTGMVYVYLMEEGKTLERNGGIPEVNGAATSGETMLYKTPGRYYIDVIGVGGEWTVTVEELR